MHLELFFIYFIIFYIHFLYPTRRKNYLKGNFFSFFINNGIEFLIEWNISRVIWAIMCGEKILFYWQSEWHLIGLIFFIIFSCVTRKVFGGEVCLLLNFLCKRSNCVRLLGRWRKRCFFHNFFQRIFSGYLIFYRV